mgnify:CR=1 FL=1
MNKKVVGGILTGVAIAAGVAITYLDYTGAVYECHKCGAIHQPTIGAYLMGMHIPGKRLLKCPHCGDRNWHYKANGMRAYLS